MTNKILSNPIYTLISCLLIGITYSHLIMPNLYSYFGISKGYQVSELTFIDFFSGVFFVAIAEEAIFRYPLKKGGETLVLFLFIALIAIGLFAFQSPKLLFILLLCFAYVGILFIKHRKNIKDVYDKHQWFWWISTSTVFCLVHSFYLDHENISIYQKYLFTLIAYTPVTAFLVFIRVRHGFKYAVILHALVNFFILSINHFIYISSLQ